MRKFLCGILCAVLLFVFFLSLFRPTPQSVKRVSSITAHPTKISEKANIIELSAWLASWDERRGIDSLRAAGSTLHTISPAWYKMDTSGRIDSLQSPLQNRIIQLARINGSQIIPTIGNDFDAKRVSLFLHNKILQSSESARLAKEAVNHGFSGWDLDWEQIYPADKDAFTDFVRKFATRLHADKLQLVVTVHAKTGDNDWQGSLGQDWESLSESADLIRIMAYDFHNEATFAGPVTPVNKLEQVIQYARSQIPIQKIVLGLPTYGYDWTGDKGIPLQFQESTAVLARQQGLWKEDTTEHALKGSYQKEGIQHTLWFENAKTIIDKIDLAKQLGVTKFILWRLGGEDPSLWSATSSARIFH